MACHCSCHPQTIGVTRHPMTPPYQIWNEVCTLLHRIAVGKLSVGGRPLYLVVQSLLVSESVFYNAQNCVFRLSPSRLCSSMDGWHHLAAGVVWGHWTTQWCNVCMCDVMTCHNHNSLFSKWGNKEIQWSPIREVTGKNFRTPKRPVPACVYTKLPQPIPGTDLRPPQVNPWCSCGR